jgi:hypothetical protein
MNVIKAIFVVLVSMTVCFAIGVMSTEASNSQASLWVLDSNNQPVDFKAYDPGADGWQATSYEHYTDGTGKLLWTTDGSGIVWDLDTNANITGNMIPLETGATGWFAHSYTLNTSTGVATVLWAHPGLGAACLWEVQSTGQVTDFKVFETGASGWTAVSYELYSSGWAKMLWTRDNEASLWTIEPSGTVVEFKPYTPGATGWTASSYTWDPSTQYAKMLWTNGAVASLWTLDPSGNIVDFDAVDPGVSGWFAESYYTAGVSAPSSSAARSLEETASILVEKTGSGSGTITVDSQVCDEGCQELSVLYVTGQQADLTVTPAADSYFAGWEAADGTALEDIYYANPGDTVYAVFELK